ncbi:hypothetical protein KKG45_01195 [bacterium]|nr:hypothetical protein [bacterium]
MKSTVTLIPLIALTLVLARPAPAGTGRGSSTSVRLDAEPPLCGIVAAPAGETLVAGETTFFSWWASDTYPAPDDSCRVAAVLARGVPVDSVSYSDALDHQWEWVVTEVSSGNSVLQVTVRDQFGNTATAQSGSFMTLLSTTGAPAAPASCGLSAPAPNPFNPQTSASFTLSEAGPVSLIVYDLQGRLVRRLFEGALAAGTHARAWDGRGDDGRRVAGGPYLMRLYAPGGGSATRKVVLLP